MEHQEEYKSLDERLLIVFAGSNASVSLFLLLLHFSQPDLDLATINKLSFYQDHRRCSMKLANVNSIANGNDYY